MSKLFDLITAVQEKNLTKTQLESYRDDLSNLYAQLMFEMAELEKAEAVFFLQEKEVEKALGKAEPTDIAIKRKWRASEKGQRLIELSRYAKACEKILSSLKSRIFATY